MLLLTSRHLDSCLKQGGMAVACLLPGRHGLVSRRFSEEPQRGHTITPAWVRAENDLE